MKTRVAKIVGKEKVEIFEEEIPALKTGEVLVKLEAVGICGSDLHFFRHCGLGSFPSPLPIDIGHEASGTVVDGDGFPAGSQVAIEPGQNCGKCHYCTRGLFHLCVSTKFMGANDVGMFRDYAVVKAQQLMKISCPHVRAAMLEPIGVAMHAVDLVRCDLGEWAAVVGSGTIGLCLLSVLKKRGCYVVILDPLKYRLDFADTLGVDGTLINNESSDIKPIKNKFSVVFDAVGSQDSLNKSIMLAAPGAQVCVVGIPEVDLLTINPHQMRIKELSIRSSRRSNQKLEKAYSIYRDDSSLDTFATHRFHLSEIQKAFEVSSSYSDGVIKTMIVS